MKYELLKNELNCFIRIKPTTFLECYRCKLTSRLSFIAVLRSLFDVTFATCLTNV